MGLVACQTVVEVEKPKPNFLFILADDFGNHDMSSQGSSYYETPNLDRIAAEGMSFDHGYATCQVCSPSRASIMSGKFAPRHGITDWIGARTGEEWRKVGRHNKLLPPDYVRSLPPDYVTLPEALKEGGYHTFFAGKWHLGSEGSWPEDHGFDINKGGWDKGSPIGGYFSPWENPNLPNVRDGENLSMRLAAETADFIKSNKDTSFFAFLSFYAVHGPIQTTQQKWNKYQKKAHAIGLAESGFQMGHFLPIRQVQDNPVYAGLVEQMDDAIGLVLKAVEEAGVKDNTVVIFTSDNGGVAAGDAFATSNKPLRAGKGYQFEGGVREPYFIKVPWMNTSGRKTNIPASGADFYPTILDLAGLPLRPEQHQDGESLVPVLEGGSMSDRSLIWHYPHYGNQGGEPSSMIRRGDWKLIHYYEDGRKELYNVVLDIGEENDVATENPDKVKELDKELFDYLNGVGARYPEHDPQHDPAMEKLFLQKVLNERLPALENRRMTFLSDDFDPGNAWWGSSTED